MLRIKKYRHLLARGHVSASFSFCRGLIPHVMRINIQSLLDAMKTIIIIVVLVAVAAGGLLLLRQRTSGTSKARPEFSQEEYDRHYKAKEAALVGILGPMHDLVNHAIVPFQIGGAVDMYCFPNHIPGTGFATMELIEPDGTGPKANRIGTYELVAFTKHQIPPTVEKLEDHPFHKIERRMCGIFTMTGFYSYDAVLNPGETCEIPGKDGEPNKCLIFDEYSPGGIPFEIDGKKHCLLLCIEVFRSEMEYAMKHGSAEVLAKLKEAGHYPYSDLDRKPVY
jgi:hypothetical protein